MKRSKFTESQIVFALKQAETGTAVAEVCRKLGISEATFYSWKKKYGGLDPAELRRLRQLEEENAQLKRIVAEPDTGQADVAGRVKKSAEVPATKTAGEHAADGVSGLGTSRLALWQICGMDGIFNNLGISRNSRKNGEQDTPIKLRTSVTP